MKMRDTFKFVDRMVNMHCNHAILIYQIQFYMQKILYVYVCIYTHNSKYTIHMYMRPQKQQGVVLGCGSIYNHSAVPNLGYRRVRVDGTSEAVQGLSVSWRSYSSERQ